jgi:perosamine synthetase
MEKLAIHGGKPVRSSPFPKREPFGEDDIREVTEALRSQDLFYTSGNKVAAFEKEFAAKYGVPYAVASTSGTSALHIAVAALEAEPGDEIITAPVTDFGTIAGILFQGLIPVFADWKENAFNMDPDDIERKITSRTRAIIVVHLFGNPCDLDAIARIAARHKIPLIEDCCQAYCTPYRGKWVGTIGDFGCFSLQQSKHLPTGDGGVTITRHAVYAQKIALLRDKGWENRDHWGPRMYSMLGLNYRMNELTGAVARAQLRKVEAVVKKMNHLGNHLTSLIGDIAGVTACPVTPGGEHSYWLYAYKVTGFDPQEFIRALKAEGIPTGWGYTVTPIYLCADALAMKKTFGTSGYPFVPPYTQRRIEYQEGLCPVAERDLRQIGTFRIYETWSETDIEDVARAFRKVAASLKTVG